MNKLSAIVLYGRAHFYRKPRFKTVLDQLQNRLPDQVLRTAYEDMTGPALPDVIDELVLTGVQHLTVVPCGLPADLSLTRWLPGALNAHLHNRGHSLTIEITRPIEDYIDFKPALFQALAEDKRDAVNLAPPSMGKPGWSKVPEHKLQVFFCLGARCAHRGAHSMFQHLRQAMRNERGLATGPRRVICARSSCLFPCNQGPLMVVHPDGIWYGDLTQQRLDQIVQEHFLAGRPVQDAIIHHQKLFESED